MSRRPAAGHRMHALLAALCLFAVIAGCAPAQVATSMPSATVAVSATAPPEVPDGTCRDATHSYDPLPELPAAQEITDASTRRILDRGFVVVGVSGDTRLLGAYNPLTGQLEGFDIDLARAVAQSLLGSPDHVQFRVITAADRIPLLQRHEVDFVARNMSMTCARWADVGFSASYYASGQKLLVRTRPGAPTPTQSLDDMAGQRVCAPAATSSLERIASVPGAIAVPAGSHTDCLVLFQQGKVDAITGDDVVLAGLADQDPYAAVTTAPAISQEPYGLAFNSSDRYLIRYVNRVLADYEADGRWQQGYDKWFRPALGPGAGPPPARYGRAE